MRAWNGDLYRLSGALCRRTEAHVHSALSTFRYVPHQEITGTMQLEPCNSNYVTGTMQLEPCKNSLLERCCIEALQKGVTHRSVAERRCRHALIPQDDDGNCREMPPENKKHSSEEVANHGQGSWN